MKGLIQLRYVIHVKTRYTGKGNGQKSESAGLGSVLNTDMSESDVLPLKTVPFNGIDEVCSGFTT